MMEEWRAVLVDSTVISMINGHEIHKEDFVTNMDELGCFLTRNGIRMYLSKLEKKLQTKIRYLSYVDYAVSFRRGIALENENYFFEIDEYSEIDKFFVLIIYDITDNKRRLKLSKLLLGYGFRIQKSAFEAVITNKKYKELLERLPAYTSSEDSIRVYKIIGKGQVVSFGKVTENETEDIIVI